jgi:RNA polymerase sigma factor (sigma-70 family)
VNQIQFEQMSPQLRNIAQGYARRYLAHADDADDAASDAMLRLWAVHDSLRDTAHAARLAAVIARNVAIDTLRRRRPTSISGDEAHTSWLLQQESDNNTPESQLEWKEDEQWLRQRIEQLPPREMQVMRLRQTERRTNEQIAAILGISKDSVATMLSSARRKLFNQIKERNRT